MTLIEPIRKKPNIKALLSVLVISIMLLTGCSSNNDTVNDSELQSIMKTGNYIIVDVRTEEEYNNQHIIGAINIPYDEIDESTTLDKDKKILVYCQSGNRSGKALVTLFNMGYDVYNLGGIDDIDLPKE